MEVENYNYSYHTINKIIDDNRDNISLNVEERNDTSSKEKRGGTPKWIAIVLGIILLGTIAYFTLGKGETNPEPERIYAEIDFYVDSMADDYLLRGEGNGMALSEEKTALKEIIGEYNPSSPLDIIPILDGFISKVQNPSNLEMALWTKAQAYAEAEDWTSAKAVLEEISNNGDFNSARKARGILEE